MKIQKFNHSCLLIEDAGTRILIDPGAYSFYDGGAKLEQLPKIDAVFITHKHPDHCDPAVLKPLLARDHMPIYCNAEIGYHLDEAGVATKAIAVPSDITVGSLKIVANHTNHGTLPVPVPENTAFMINERLLHPGDSLTFERDMSYRPEILALPIAAPWGTATQAVEVALRLQPKYVIPIHDGIVASIFLSRLHQMCRGVLEKAGIAYHPLQPGEILEV